MSPLPRQVPRSNGPGTRCVHAGFRPDATGALVPPLVQSTTYAWEGLEQQPPNSYARSGNATVQALERRLADLEGTDSAVCFSSGLAAIDALLRSCPSGSRVVVGKNLYGGTLRLLQQVHHDRLDIHWVDSSRAEELETALATAAHLVLVETPSNPTLAITDIPAAAKLAHQAGAALAVDNTFLTPLSQQPLALGADVVIHSTTKYLDGHNATLGGALVLPESGRAGDGEGPRAERLRWIRKSTGAVLAPFEAWLTLQGTKTLHLRIQRQWSSARHLADLARRSGVLRVLHPGLDSHPGHDVHRRQSNGDGGIVALDLGTRAAATAFTQSLQLFTLAENLGAAESLATYPVRMTHSDVPEPIRRELGITDGLVRLSVGVEDAEDLAADVAEALDAARQVLEVTA